MDWCLGPRVARSGTSSKGAPRGASAALRRLGELLRDTPAD